MLTVEEITKFIEDDRNSKYKQTARIGQRYYEAEHDIKSYKLFYYNSDGELVEDRTRSNIKISHPFFTELVDQEVQYVLSGKNGFVFSDDPQLQDKLNEYFNDNEQFKMELNEHLTGVVVKGFNHMYAFKNKEGKTQFESADSLGVIELKAKDTSDHKDYVIYLYTENVGKHVITKVQLWDEHQTTYFYKMDNGALELDKTEPVNPRPHILYHVGGDERTYYDSYGFIPFFRMDNCKKRFSGLKPIKDLIDDYDLMSCGLSNNLQDASEYLVVVKGFQGNDMEELIQNTKTKKHIGVDENGGVEFKTVDVPYDARKAKLELDEKNIYRFGMGFNSAQLGDGNVTNVVIKSRYALLDIKANKLEIRLREFLSKLVKIALDEINQENKTNYTMKDVYFEFEREIITNASDNAAIEKTDAEKKQVEINTLLGLVGKLDDETIMQRVCETLDVDYEKIKAKLPKDETQATLEAYGALDE